MKVLAPRVSFYAKHKTHEIISALDGAFDKVISQIRKHKERVKDRRQNVPHSEVVKILNPATSEMTLDVDFADPPEIVPASEKFAAKPLTVNEAVAELHTSGET